MSHRRHAHAIVVTALASVATAQTSVVLRGEGTPLDAPVEAIGPAGVLISGGEARTIGWDSVKAIIGDLAPEAEAYRSLADRSWRARQRLARGDLPMAEPLFESLHAELRDAPGPTALMVSEGLLRCRLRRGDQSGAFEPWLEAVDMRDEGWRVAGDPPLMPVLDPEFLLAAALPPVWIDDVATTMFVETESGAPGITEGEEIGLAASLRAMYVAAAQFEVGGVELEGLPAMSHPGAALVRDIVLSRAGDGAARTRAREALEAGIGDGAGDWKEAWRRAAVGRSLLRETDDSARRRGVLHLLHLPARFGSSQPWLTGVALAEVSLELARSGDARGAATLRAVLERTDPHHPALAWLDSKRNSPTSNGPPAATSKEDP